MGQFGQVNPGDDVRRILKNAAWINHVTNAADLINPRPSSPGSAGVPAQSRLVLDVVNDTGAAIDVPFPILRITEPVVSLSDNANVVFGEPQFMGDTPNADTGASFVVVQGPIGTGVAQQSVLTGMTWCKVDVGSESDTHATSIDGDNEKLQSGTAGVRIVWKESGTGEKWALVLLGGGGGGISPTFVMIFKTVPPFTRMQNCAYLVELNSSVASNFEYVFTNPDALPEDEDYLKVKTIGIHNFGFNPIVGYEEPGEGPLDPIIENIYIPAFGLHRFTVNEAAEGDEDPEPETFDFDYLTVVNFDLASLPGTKRVTLNNKPQGPTKPNGGRLFYNDGGPCTVGD